MIVTITPHATRRVPVRSTCRPRGDAVPAGDAGCGGDGGGGGGGGGGEHLLALWLALYTFSAELYCTPRIFSKSLL